VGHAEALEDFVLEAEFLFDGSGQGGIVLRGDREAPETWKAGYELDIDWAADRKRGHLHFPVNPASYKRQELLFDVGKWHALRVEARGPHITVTLDGKETIAIEGGEFPRGQICLEDGPCQVAGHSGPHVRYRSLRVRRL
jgi:hypothetical protein